MKKLLALGLLLGIVCDAKMPLNRKKFKVYNDKKFKVYLDTLSDQQNPVILMATFNEINNERDLNAALGSGRPFIINVSAPWCGVCKISKEPFARAHEKYKDQVDVYRLNFDNTEARRALQNEFGKVEGLPTFILVPEDGKGFYKQIGTVEKETGYTELFSLLAPSGGASNS